MVKIRRAITIQVTGLILVAFVVALLSRVFPLADILADVQQRVMHLGAWSAIFYPLLYACCNVLLLPGGVLSIGGGFFFWSLVGFSDRAARECHGRSDLVLYQPLARASHASAPAAAQQDDGRARASGRTRGLENHPAESIASPVSYQLA